MNETNCIPINQTAANVIKGGFSKEYIHNGNHFHSEIPIRLHRKVPKDLEDYTGKKYGNFTVIGYVRKKISKEEKMDKRINVTLDGRGGVNVEKRTIRSFNVKAHWLVKCCCGKYETRTSKSIKKASKEDCCQECKERKFLIRQDFFNRHGRWPDQMKSISE